MAGRPQPLAPLALLLLSVLLSPSVGGGTCPPVVCMCSWTEGRGSAVCVNGSLTEVPAGLSAGTTALQLDGNPLQVLTAGAFLGNGLAGLQRLQLARCQLGHIDRRAFSGYFASSSAP